MSLVTELPTGLGVALERELRLGFELDKATAEARQGKIGAMNRKEVRSIDGLGALNARVDSSAYHYWGKRLGYDCWQDKAFLNEFLRDNPQSKVKSLGTKIQVGHGS